MQNPGRFERQIVESPIPLGRVVLEAMLTHRCPVHGRDFHRSICATGVDDKHVTPQAAQALEAVRQIRFFVIGEYDH